MAEVGCLKDGNFQNLEASRIMLGTSSLAAPLETNGKNVLDIVTTQTGGDHNILLNATHLNSIYYITAARAGQAAFIKLPLLTECSPGDKITFFLAVEPAVDLRIIQQDANDEIYGTVPVYAPTSSSGAQASAATIMAVFPGGATTGVQFGAGVTKANIGSTLTFTCIGGTETLTQAVADPATNLLAIPVTDTSGSTKNWHISGFIVGDANAMKGTSIVV